MAHEYVQVLRSLLGHTLVYATALGAAMGAVAIITAQRAPG